MNRASYATVNASGKPAASREADLVGHGQSGSFVNGHQLGLRSASDHRHDPIADDETFGTRTNCRHNARELEARDVGRPTRRCRVQAGPLQQVGPVQARSLNPDQQFASARDRVGSLRSRLLLPPRR